MKKVLLFVAVVSAFSFASCKKDHTCTCTTSAAGFTSDASVVTYTKCKKGDARAACLSSTGTDGSTTWTKTCTLN